MQLAQVQARFSELIETGALESAFDRWSQRKQTIAVFQRPDDLIRFLTDSSQLIGEQKNIVIDALCGLATEGDQPAALLLLWLFKGAFRNIQKTVGECPLSPEELESEMTAAFWEGVANRKGAEKLAGRLYYRVLQATWRAVGKARSEIHRRAELHSEIVDTSERCTDPSHLVLEAVRQGAVDDLGAELILATRVDGSSIGKVAPAFRLSPEAAGMRRNKAERALAAFLASRASWDSAEEGGRVSRASSLRRVLVANFPNSSLKSPSRKSHALGIGPPRCLLKVPHLERTPATSRSAANGASRRGSWPGSANGSMTARSRPSRKDAAATRRTQRWLA